MRTHIEALSALIDDLFELSRLEAGDIQWTIQQVALGQLVEETVDAMRPHAAAKGVSVRADVRGPRAGARESREGAARAVQPDPERDPPHPGGRRGDRAAPRRPTGGWRSRWPTRATGSAPTTGSACSTPFYRGGSEAARTRAGAGLGLAISRAIVEAHGGRIWLADSPSGTRVRFSLPQR